MIRRAFTLLEVLVVISILGCLLAVVLPSLRYSRMKAQAVVCSVNLKQIGTALNSYADIQKTYPPGFCDLPGYNYPPGGQVGTITHDWHGWWWFHFLTDYGLGVSEPQKSLLCSSTPQQLQTMSYFLCGKYGVNYYICKIAAIKPFGDFVGPSMKPTSLSNTSRIFLAMDAGYALMGWTAAQLNPAKPFDIPKRADSFFIPGLSINKCKSINSLQKKDAIDGRHVNKTINVAYCDGHVENISSETMLVDDLAPQSSPSYSSWAPCRR